MPSLSGTRGSVTSGSSSSATTRTASSRTTSRGACCGRSAAGRRPRQRATWPTCVIRRVICGPRGWMRAFRPGSWSESGLQRA
ncbi:hypothetical protein ACFPRL_19695 [Pseudoclavibacter helvolus]